MTLRLETLSTRDHQDLAMLFDSFFHDRSVLSMVLALYHDALRGLWTVTISTHSDDRVALCRAGALLGEDPEVLISELKELLEELLGAIAEHRDFELTELQRARAYQAARLLR